MMDEIASISAELEAYQKIVEIEEKKRKDALEMEQKSRREEEERMNAEANQYQLMMEDQLVDKEDAIRRGLVHEILDEAADNGTPISPAILKFLQHFKRNIVFFFF